MLTRLLKFLIIICVLCFSGIELIRAQKHKQPSHEKRKECKVGRKKNRPFTNFLSQPAKWQMDSVASFIKQKRHDKLIDFVKKQVSLVYKDDDIPKVIMFHYQLGRVFQRAGMVHLATENFLKSLEVSQNNKMVMSMIEVSLHLSKINYYLRDKKNNVVILNYLLPHLNTFKELGKRNAVAGIIAETYLSSALICKEMEDDQKYKVYLDSAQYYFNDVIPNEKFPPFMGVAQLKIEKGLFKEAIPLLLKRLNFRGKRDPGILNNILNNLVICHIGLNEINNALKYKDQLINSLQRPFLPGKVVSCLTLSKLFKSVHQYDSAYYYLNQAYKFKNVLENEKVTKLTNELNIKYQSEKKDFLLASQKHKIFKKDRTILILVVSTILVTLLLVKLYRNNLLKKKSNLLLKYKNQMIVEQSKQLEKLTNYKESLTSMIVHDLKNPINSIIGLSTDFLSHKNLRVIHNSGKKMLSLVLNILDVQKFEEARFELQVANCSMNKLISSAIKETEYLSNEKNIYVSYDSAINYFVDLDFDIIQRVLINIITNAIKYSDFNKNVKIKIFPWANGTLAVSINDEGMGIPEDQIPHVFDKFWQYKSKKSGGVRSVGLGLTFCKMAVDAHNGNINVKSILGKGTTFTVCLPHVNSYQIVTQDTKRNHDNLGEKYNHTQLLYLEKFAKKLRRYKAYEISEILNVLNQIDAEDIQIRSWKEEMENIIISGNNKQFKLILDRLLNISNHQQ